MNRSNLVTWVRDSLASGKHIEVVDDQFRMPTLVDDLADGIISIVERNKTGLFHLCGPEMTSVYDFAIKTAMTFNLDSSLISRIKSEKLNQPGRRPVSTGFVLDRAIEELDFSPKNLQEGLLMVQNLLDDFTGKTDFSETV
jgi:dTDP-4-dehydrorhamnose reductase